MAGAAGSWYKTGKATKGRVFISKETIRDSLGGASVTDAELAKARASLVADPERYSSMIATLAGASPQPAGQAKRASAPAGYQIPQRSQADKDALIAKTITKTTQTYNAMTAYSGDKPVDEAQAAAILQGVLERIVAESNVSSMVNQDVLTKILDSGFKNQHQTRTSGGFLNPKARALAENLMFDIPEDSPPEAFPIYGILVPRSFPDAIGLAGVYGDIQVIFKDSVRDRTTMSVDDSLYEGKMGRLMPSPINAPSIASVDGNGSSLLRNRDRDMNEIGGDISYFEAQIHGPTTASDIARLRFSRSGGPSADLAAKLDALGIPWEIATVDY